MSSGDREKETEKEQNEEPLLLLSLKSYSSNSREEMKRESSSQRRRINWAQTKGNEAAALGVKTQHRSHGGNKLSELYESWETPVASHRELEEMLSVNNNIWRGREETVQPTLMGMNASPAVQKAHSAPSSPCFPGGWTWSWWLWCCLDFWSTGSVGSDPTQTSSRYHPELPSSLKNKPPPTIMFYDLLHTLAFLTVVGKIPMLPPLSLPPVGNYSAQTTQDWIPLSGNTNNVTTRSHKKSPAELRETFQLKTCVTSSLKRASNVLKK